MFAAFALVVGSCSDDDGNDEASAEFTGDDCVYSGPTEFDVGDEYEITVSDVTEERTDVGFALSPVPAGTTVAEVREKGIDKILTEDEIDDSPFLISATTEEGTQRVLAATLDVTGIWLVYCFAMNPDGVFPATTFEVVEKS